jgi:hypothetical protein
MSETGEHPEIIINDWRPHSDKTLRGFFTATLPSGLVLRDLKLHERAETRWIGFPAREWTNLRGQKQYTQHVDFTSRATRDRFQDAVLVALDHYLAEAAR